MVGRVSKSEKNITISKNLSFRERLFQIIQIGYGNDWISRSADGFIAAVIVINLISIFCKSFDSLKPYMNALDIVEFVTTLIFAIEYILRLWTCDLLYPKEKTRFRAVLRFVFSFYGIVDLISFLPYFLPFFFPMGMVAFRMLRVIRILRLFRINAYYDAFNVITDVLNEKKDQILSAIFIIIMMVMAASLIMYDLEHEAQPEVFTNAFSGIWWAVSTLLTVGYGDIYPITVPGKVVGIILAFLGVGIVAIPTGIISAGFVEQYTRLKKQGIITEKWPVDFVTVKLEEGNEWIGRKPNEIELPDTLILVAIIRDNCSIIPRYDTLLEKGDRVALGAKTLRDENDFIIEEISVRTDSGWDGMSVVALDAEYNMDIVLVRRGKDNIIPDNGFKIQDGDKVIVYRRLELPS